MTDKEFRKVLHAAITGDHAALEIILDMYGPLIRKNSHIDGIFDEDLHQYILIHIALKISQFNI